EQLDGPLRLVGSDSPVSLGVPLLRSGEAAGAALVQRHRRALSVGDWDGTLLGCLPGHFLTALDRQRSTALLGRGLPQRTQELAEANRGLQQEVAERQRAERLQAALFQVAQLATDDIGEEEFYARIHGIVGQLLNAENFFIALVSEDGRSLEFPYYVDIRLKTK